MSEEEVEYYGDPRIVSADANVPRWLKWSYVFIVLWGLSCFIYWNGSFGWLDRGYWKQLQEAANTTFPFRDAEDPSQK